MKRALHPLIAVLFLLGIASPASAAKQWIIDQEFGFKIQIPDDFQRNSQMQGSDKVHIFSSPDNNLGVFIRAFSVGKGTTHALMEKTWREKILLNSTLQGSQKDTVNGITGTVYVYSWDVDGTPCVAAAFFTIQNNLGYIVWVVVPKKLYQLKTKEADAITNTFTLLVPQKKQAEPATPSVSQIDPPSKIAPPKSLDKNWRLINLDNFVKFEIPAHFTLQQKKPSMFQWWDPKSTASNRVKIIAQAVQRKGSDDFKTMIQGLLDQVKNKKGATLISNQVQTHASFRVQKMCFELVVGQGEVDQFTYAMIDAPGEAVVWISYVVPKPHAKQVPAMFDRMLKSLKSTDEPKG